MIVVVVLVMYQFGPVYSESKSNNARFAFYPDADVHLNKPSGGLVANEIRLI